VLPRWLPSRLPSIADFTVILLHHPAAIRHSLQWLPILVISHDNGTPDVWKVCSNVKKRFAANLLALVVGTFRKPK